MSADRSCSRSGSADATQFPPADRCPKGDARRVLFPIGQRDRRAGSRRPVFGGRGRPLAAARGTPLEIVEKVLMEKLALSNNSEAANDETRWRHISEPQPRPLSGYDAPVGYIWRPAVADANLAGLRIYDLRHTAVVLWIVAGASPKEVAARAGHTSVSFVLDRYSHLFPEADTALRARLDGLFRAATEHARLEREQDTLRLIRLGCPELGGSCGAPPGTRTPNRCLKSAGQALLRPATMGRHGLRPGHLLTAVVRC
jgi:hypothetical protein